jgi:hypothetical protein
MKGFSSLDIADNRYQASMIGHAGHLGQSFCLTGDQLGKSRREMSLLPTFGLAKVIRGVEG